MGITDVPIQRLPALDARYSPLGGGAGGFTAGSGDLAPAGYNLIPNGQYIKTGQTITAALVALIFPSLGGTSVWQVIAFHANGTHTVVTTVTIAAGARAAQITGLSYSAVAGDFILAVNTQANGTSYKGLGPSVLISFGGSITIPTAPAAVTSFTATPGSNFVDLAWTGGAAATDYIVTVNGIPQASTGITSYRDLGPAGTGLSTGATNVYDIIPGVPLAFGPTSGTPRTSGPASVFNYFAGQADGAMDATHWLTAVGTGSGTITANTQVAGFVSGTNGNNNAQDRVNLGWIKSGNTYSALDMLHEWGMGTTNCVVDLWMCADALSATIATLPLNGIKIEFNAGSYKVSFVTGGVSTNLTINGSTQATTTSATGAILWPIGVTADATATGTGHFYGFFPDLQVIDSGTNTQVLNLYFGTTGQAETNPQSMPLINTITLTSTQVNQLAAASGTRGSYGWQLLGAQSLPSPVQQKFYVKTLTMTPLSAANH